MQNICTLKAWRAICCRAIEDAQQGDAPARNWLSRYLIGEPRQTVLVHDQGRTVDHVGEVQRAVEMMHSDEHYVDYLRHKSRLQDYPNQRDDADAVDAGPHKDSDNGDERTRYDDHRNT